MNRYYHFLINGRVNKTYLKRALDALKMPYDLFYFDDSRGYIASDEKFGMHLDDVLAPLHEDLGANIGILALHKINYSNLDKSLKEALIYFPNRCVFLSDILYKEFSFNDYSSIPYLAKEFRMVNHEVMMTAGAFLRCGLNACYAAEILTIHRNTFNYRLEKFIDKTGLDIRDYHNALLLEIYFQFGNPR